MSRLATRTRNVSRKKKKVSRPWLAFWPLLLALVITPVAMQAAGVLALSGPQSLRLLYPYVVLAQKNAHQISIDQMDLLAQWMLYGQFVLYGLIWVTASRWMGRSAGPLIVLLLHVGGVGLAMLTSAPAAT